jgi:hypothetical protein
VIITAELKITWDSQTQKEIEQNTEALLRNADVDLKVLSDSTFQLKGTLAQIARAVDAIDDLVKN